ncbi:MAG: helix-turn-helix domain-containing protein [Eubacteriales bacterium]|nr:helix-turn-helix domain-containing protein [Eubacteriales bacterium]
MKNPNIAAMLKYYRKLNKLTVQDVSQYLDHQGKPTATKTIYGWESGQTQPSADTLMYLCSLYQIDDILGTFGYINSTKEEPIHLTPHERKLIRAYRKQTDMQPAVDKLLDLDQ